MPGSISAAATTYDAGSARKRGLFPPAPGGSGDKVSFLALLLAVIVVVIMVVTMMVVVAMIVVMMIVVVVVMMIAPVRIGVELFDTDRLLRHIGKLGDEIDHLVLE